MGTMNSNLQTAWQLIHYVLYLVRADLRFHQAADLVWRIGIDDGRNLTY